MLIVRRTRFGIRRHALRRVHGLAGLAALFALVLGVAAAGYFAGRHHGNDLLAGRIAGVQADLARQTAALAELRNKSRAGINAVAARMAELDARLNRLDAMGKQVVNLAGLEQSGFDFNASPGEGGPEPQSGRSWKLPDLAAATEALADRVWREQSELAALEAVLLHRKYNARTVPRGKPIGQGWISSGYGWRTDPISGERAFHQGLDFAGHEGDPVRAIAAGVVTWAGPHYGYGKLIIVNDGSGYNTWYAHCEKVLVQVGDVIARGDKIALVGETGRATGPHVHLEVHHDGSAVNPWPFVKDRRGG